MRSTSSRESKNSFSTESENDDPIYETFVKPKEEKPKQVIKSQFPVKPMILKEKPKVAFKLKK